MSSYTSRYPAHHLVERALDAHTLGAIFQYDPALGKLTRIRINKRARRTTYTELVPKAYDGDVYHRIKVSGKFVYAHRVIWALFYGEWPCGIIDHINRNPLDNRIANLRLATFSLNGANSTLDPRNKTGFRGVRHSMEKNRYEAIIKKDGKEIRLGSFTKIEDAALAYDKAATTIFGEFAYTNARRVADATGRVLEPAGAPA